jgi:hypothetical protein
MEQCKIIKVNKETLNKKLKKKKKKTREHKILSQPADQTLAACIDCHLVETFVHDPDHILAFDQELIRMVPRVLSICEPAV